MRTCTYLDPHHQERCTECGITIDLCLCADVHDMAHHRLASPEGKTMRTILFEVDAARDRIPDNTHILATLVGEVGALAQALMEHDRGQGTTTQMVYRKAIQVSAMAIRVAVDGDQNFLYESTSLLGD